MQVEKLSDRVNPGFDDEQFKIVMPTDVAWKFLRLDTLSQLDEDHPARQYIISRKIPDVYQDYFRWAPNFKSWTNEFIPGKFESTDMDEARIIIPYFDADEELFAYNSRSLKNNGLRYIKIVLDASIPNIFGLDRINPEKDIFVFEGEFDSCFFQNSVACGGQNLNQLTNVADVDKFIIILDNEPRSVETRKKITTAVRHGFRVCIWPETIEEKDINKMILSGYSAHHLQTVIEENTFQGLKADVRLSEWSKVR